MAPRKPKTIPPFDIDDIIERFSNTTTTTIPGAPVAPVVPTTSTPTTANNVGRGLSPAVRAEENKLRYDAQRAQNLGIDTSKYFTSPTELPFVPTGNANIDAIVLNAIANKEANKPKGKSLLGQIGAGALGALGDVVNVVDIPRRLVISGIKETADAFNGGDASKDDFFSQVGDRDLSSRIILPQSKRGWLNATLGFVGDVLLDPTTYLTLGGSVIVKNSINIGVKLAVKEVADAGAEKLLKVGIDKAAIEASQKNADDFLNKAIEISDELVQKGVGSADEVLIAQQRASVAAQQAADLTADAAKKLDGRGGKILKAEEARVAAYNAWASSSGSATKAALKVLDDATSAVAKAGLIRGGAKRQYRATAREILGENATQLRNYADDVIKAADAKGLKNLTKAEQQALNGAIKTSESLSDDIIADIYKRGYGALRGAGADAGLALGTKTGTRLGIGKASVYFTKGRLTGVGGRALTGLRAGAFSANPGLVELMTPLGRKGIFGDADLLKMRRVLQTGKDEVGNKVGSDLIKTYGSAIALNRSEEVIRKRILSGVASAAKQAVLDVDEKDYPSIIKFLEDGVPISDVVLQAKAQRVRNFLDNTYREYTRKVQSMGDVAKNKIKNYFPNVMTNNAMEWSARNPSKLELVAKGIGTNKQRFVDNFIERELVPGKVWFGTVLTVDDIRGGVKRLNELANNAGFKGEFFETNVKKALLKYSQKHAANLSFLQTISKFSDSSADDILNALKGLPGPTEGFIGPTEGFLDDISKVFSPDRIGKSNVVQRAKVESLGISADDYNNVQDALNNLSLVFSTDYSPSKLRFFSRNAVYEVEQRLITIQGLIDDVLTMGDTGVSQKLLKEIEDLQTRVIEVVRNRELPDATQKLTLDEIDQTIARTADDMNVEQAADLKTRVNALVAGGGSLRDLENGDRLFGYSPSELLSYFGKTDRDKWRKITRSLTDGFETLDFRDIPDIGARKEVAAMFNRLQNMTDQKFSAGLEKYMGDFNTFFKSWATATVGFHFRNTLSNAFQLVAMGAGLRSMSEGIFYYNRYVLDTSRFAAEGKRFLSPDEWVKTLKLPGTEGAKAKKRQVISEALILTGADGQMSDVFNDAVRVGISGQEVEDIKRLSTIRGVLGRPLKASRALGEYVEGTTRFISNFDGLMKGLDSEETLARTNKYLFDYQNLSNLDRVAKFIVPFWIWTSRNFPLYIENLFTNPRAYAQYGALRRGIGQDEQLPYIGTSNEEVGAFGLNQGLTDFLNSNPVTSALTGGDSQNKFFRPDLGFPGAGRPSQLDLLIRAVPALLGGETEPLLRTARESLSSVSPILQLPFEAATGKSLFRNQDIANRFSSVPASEQIALNTLGKLLPAYQSLGRTAGAIQGLGNTFTGGENQTLANILGILAPDTERQRMLAGLPEPYTPEGLSEEEISERLLQQGAGAIGSFLGSPVRGLTDANQSAEISRRRRAIAELILREQNRRRKEEE